MAGTKGGGLAAKQERGAKEARTPDAGGDMGDSEANFNAIHIMDDEDDDNASADSGLVRAAPSSASNGRTVSTDGAKVNFEVETRQADGNSSNVDDAMSRERRLTIKQLERFRRAMARRSRRSSRANTRWGNGQNQGDDAEFDDLFGDRAGGPGKELRFATYPWPYWIFGGVVVIATSIFVERVHANSLGAEQQGNQDWWKYLVAFLVYSIAFGLVANGRVETFVMSKEQGRLLIRSTKPLCLVHKLRRERCVDRELREIVDIRVEASGEFSGDIDTRCYKIHFEFEDGAHATALELRCKKRTLERCRLIKDFLFSCVTASAVAATPRGLGAAGTPPASPVAPRKETLPSVPSSSLPRKNTGAGAPESGAAAIVPLKLDTIG